MTSVEVVPREGGAPVVVKRATDAPDAARLAHEAEVLDVVRGPGVVDLVGFDAGDTGAELQLAWAGQHTLATIGSIGVRPAARTVLAVAETVARLHDLGVAHTRLTADHVVVGADGTPTLCGFSLACRGDEQAMAADVVGLGDLLSALVGDVERRPLIPERRRRHVHDEPERLALLTLADRAAAPGLAHRPSAATFAEALRGTLPTPPPPRRPRQVTPVDLRKLAPVLAAVIGVVAVLAVAQHVGAARTRAPADAAPATTVIVRTTTTLSPEDEPTSPSMDDGAQASATTAPAVSRPATRCPEVAPPAADVDGDGCLDPYRVDGSAVVARGTTYEVGAPGDLVAVADWDCDGRATPAVVRPATGEVFVFDAWATTGRDATVRARAVVDRATGIRPAGTGRCPDLVVSRETGAPFVIRSGR